LLSLSKDVPERKNTSVESAVFKTLSPVKATLKRILRQAQDEEYVGKAE